jgi:hypothetical protein
VSPRAPALTVASPFAGGRLALSVVVGGLWGPLVLLPSLGAPNLSWQSPTPPVAGLLASHGPLAVDRPPLGPLAWRPLPAVPSTCWSRPPRRARGTCPPRGLPPAFLQEGSGGRCLGWTLCASAGYWGSPADARCAARRVRLPFGPLAWRPSPRSPLDVLVPTPRRARGLRPPPGHPACGPHGGVGRPLLGLGRSAPPRVVGARRPMPVVAHGCLSLRHPAVLRPFTAAFAWGPGGLVLFSVVPSSGGLSSASWFFYGLLLVSVWGPSGLLHAGGLSCCP